jgi:hypothetical protein
MKGGHIAAVEFLTSVSDAERITEARKLFEATAIERDVDGFEVWEGPRFIYRYPEAPPISA